MPAKSEVQQGAAGAALAAKRGEMPVSKLYGASKEMYKGMSGGQLRHFAKTKHKGLPHKKSLMSMNSHGQMNSVGYPHPKACLNNMEALDDELESSASQIVSKLLDEEVPGEERLEVRAARNIMDAAHSLQSSLPEMTPEQGAALHTIMREANSLIRMHRQ